MDKPKYPKYQDYVIKNGKLVGEFEQMYQDYDDPWCQSKEEWASDKAIAIHWMKKLGISRVVELGCGLGQFTNNIQKAGFDVLGLDISSTAVEKAQLKYPACKFRVGDILDYDIYREFRPDVVVMAEITWYVLDKIDDFLRFMKEHFNNTYLIHLLVTYPPGVQKHGREKFTSLSEILKYFDMEYLEWGEIRQSDNDTMKTFFLGRWS